MGKALILSIAILAGCTTVPAPVENPRQVWCDTNEPLRYSPSVIAAMTREELDEYNSYHSKGEKWCEWVA
jgi:starvation-inducible outer membrane lipoprotein